MRIVLAGGTGFIGRAMMGAYRAQHTLEVLTRHPDRARLPEGVRAVGWDGATLGAWAERLDGADAVINLVGERIAQRWTPAVKQRLWDSRVKTTALLVQAAQQARTPPRIWLQASAIGIYDQSPDTTADESSPPASGFLADLGKAWEAAAQPVASLGVRLCYYADWRRVRAWRAARYPRCSPRSSSASADRLGRASSGFRGFT
jgi:NAD dependent epimerase/dehydratase family enzyme